MNIKSFVLRNACIVLLLLLYAHSAFSQSNFKVTGKVTDETGKPVQSVTVQVKGSTASTVTRQDGSFEITAPSATSTLVFSSVGFTSTEVAINNRADISVSLAGAATTMSDVVVIGYGTRRRGDVTGAISSVNADDIKQVPVTNVSQALQGRVPGLVATPNSFRPGSGSTIRIRGARSLTANNNPLYVVDGIPLDINNTIDDINPLDIESIDVLKDASATAIYGSRGANGVIQITTKKGRSGKISVDYSGTVSFDNILVPLEVFSASEWTQLKRDGFIASGSYNSTLQPTNANKIYFPDAAADFQLFRQRGDIYTWRSVAEGYTWRNYGQLLAAKRATTQAEKDFLRDLKYPILDSIAIFDPSKITAYDWQNDALRTGISQSHNISLTGGSDKFRSAFSAGYFDQKGIEYGQDYKRYSFGLSTDFKPNKILNIGGNVNYSNSIQNLGTSLYTSASYMLPIAQPYDSTGKIIFNPGNDANIVNPLNDANSVLNELRVNRMLANIYLEIQLYKGLKFRSAFGADFRNERQGTFNGSQSSVRAGGLANASYTTRMRLNWTLQNILSYETRFGDHNISVMGAQELLKSRFEANTMSAENLSYESQLWYSLQNNNLATVTGSGTFEQYQLSSLLGRINYSYKDKYIVTGSVRSDNSSVLAEGHKGETFPSGAVAWRIDKEGFMAGVNWVNLLKLRFGYGEVGNSSVAPYQTGGTLTRSLYNWGGVAAAGYAPNTLPLPDLTWEKTKTKNIALDFGLFKNRVTGTIDVYESNSDQIQNMVLPAAGGIPRILLNIGNVRNQGVELNLGTTIMEKPNGLRWTADVVASYNKATITNLSSTFTQDIGNQWFVGSPNQIYYDWKLLGMFQYSDTVKGGILYEYFWKKAGNKANANYQPGRAYLKDLNGDTLITDVDKMILGSHNPKWTGSFNTTVSFKGFDLSVYVYGQFGGMTRVIRPSLNARYQSMKVDYWTPTNPSNEYAQANNTVDIQQYFQAMSFRSSDFVRVRSISLAYHLPKSLTSRAKLNNVTVSLNVVNPFYISDYRTSDVETVPYMSSYPTSVNSGPNVNSYSFRSFVAGLSLGL
jgi:TonB-linked SusC/RagA family outer membrane protein